MKSSKDHRSDCATRMDAEALLMMFAMLYQCKEIKQSRKSVSAKEVDEWKTDSVWLGLLPSEMRNEWTVLFSEVS